MDLNKNLKEDAEFITFPSSRVTLNNSQKKELPACMYARQLESQVLRTQNNTSVKAIFIPRRKKINNLWV